MTENNENQLSTQLITEKPQQLNTIIFENTNLSDLYGQIYTNSKQLKCQLMDLIKDISSKIVLSVDVQFIGPTLASIINASINNDKHLIDLANSAQKILLAKKSNNPLLNNNIGFINQDQLNQIQKNNSQQLQSMTNIKQSLNQLKSKKSEVLRKIKQQQIQYVIDQSGQYKAFDQQE